MQSQRYQAQQLKFLLESQLKKNMTGVLALETKVNSWQKQRIGLLMFHNGGLVYADSIVPSNQQFAKSLGDQFQPNFFNVALEIASEKLTNPQSVRELMEILVRLKVFKWENIETYAHQKVVSILEKFDAYPGVFQWNDAGDFDLCFGEDFHGLNWAKIKRDLGDRAEQWANLAPTIPSMDAVPYVRQNSFAKVSDSRVREHLKTHADGRHTLVEIATAIGQDPLKVAVHYVHWSHSGVVNFVGNLESNDQAGVIANKTNLPTVLSVDDSPIVQLSIKRALNGHYNVLLTHQVSEALNILNRNSIDLLLLDLTMPEMDGLDFCKMIRKIDKFRNLPIVILTARDGLMDQVKCQMTGANKYMHKPFTPEQLLAIANQYTKVHF